jgi:hypothetical protein
MEDYDGELTAPELPWFDDQGRPVLVDPPAVYDDPLPDTSPHRDYGKLFSLLIRGAPDAATVYHRVMCWAYLLKAQEGPRTLNELGLALGISRQAAHKRLTAFRALLPKIAREIGFDG